MKAAFFCDMTRLKGTFITFEGIDGCGKSTQARKLYAYLKRKGYTVRLLREPGGTPISERIRRLLLNRDMEIRPISELLLYEAARAQLAEKVILPALIRGEIVLCDRYFDSTTAYQGYGRRIDLSLIERLNRMASLGISPDLTFVFDIDYATSLSRRRKKPDRLEKEKQAFFNRVRRGFCELACRKRMVLLNGRKDIETLFVELTRSVLPLIKNRKIGRAG